MKHGVPFLLSCVSILTLATAPAAQLDGDERVDQSAPVARFSASPSMGSAPLTVTFEDRSAGEITAWAWDFGDGTRSRLRSPVHVYERQGPFTVTLTVEGPGGTHTETQENVVRVYPVLGMSDGDFEEQQPGTTPKGAWRVMSGRHRILPLTDQRAVPSDGDFPTRGRLWLGVSADGSTAAVPPSVPGGLTEPPRGAVGVRQGFTYVPERPVLSFDAAFLLDGLPFSETDNDFVSVDITDGPSTYNLFYRDSFSPFQTTSRTFGLPMTPVERVRVDLAELFPEASDSTLLLLTVQVGNGGADERPSKGFFDDFRLDAPASVALRLGSGLNPATLSTEDLPLLGQTWTAEVSTRHQARAGLTILVGAAAPQTPGYAHPWGELLIDPSSQLFFVSAPVVDARSQHALRLPGNDALIGTRLSLQAVVIGGRPTLSNALDLVLGL